MKKTRYLLFFGFACMLCLVLSAQISLVSSLLSPNNINERSLLNINLNNETAKGIDVSLEIALTDGDNLVLMTASSNRFVLPSGVHFLAELNQIQLGKVQWQNTEKANYIKNNQLLPSGNFHVCYKVIPYSVIEVPEIFCEDINSEGNSFLLLVNPADEDTIETTKPTLVWNHSEGFSLNSSSEFYRLLVCEKTAKESAEEAIVRKLPVLQKDFLNVHQINYSNEQKELEKGKTYAWQVVKMCNGIPCQKSDVWQFTVKKDKQPIYNQYAELNYYIEPGVYYTASEGMVFFRFEEFYVGSYNINLVLTDGNKILLNEPLSNFIESDLKSTEKSLQSFNRFKLDLNQIKKLKKGFYYLEILNQKSQKYKLKIYYEG
jgi:hypothetical protein